MDFYCVMCYTEYRLKADGRENGEGRVGSDLVLHLQLENQLQIAINFSLSLSLLGLLFSVLGDPYLKKRHRIQLLLATIMAFVLLVQSQLDPWFGYQKNSLLGRTIAAMIGYQLRPLILMLFISLTEQEKIKRRIWIPVVVNALIYSTALFSGITFSFSEDFSFHRGPLGFTCHVISFGLLIYLLVLSIRKFGMRKHLETLTPVGIAVVITGATVADSFWGNEQWISYLTAAMVVSCTLYYQWIHLQFAREHERALLAEQKVQIMIAQIQPHFLYNTLSTIQDLCKRDPNKAYEVIEHFEDYLHQNSDYLNRTGLIPFQKELEHTKVYMEIEMVRFPNIHLDLDVRETDFLVPALSLQPIVEDALRHGVHIREQGVIRVSASREEGYYEIIVWDNGKIFQADAVHEGEDIHIGIRNVRERIEKMCDGTLEVESFPGDGTVVTMRFPVDRQLALKKQESKEA